MKAKIVSMNVIRKILFWLSWKSKKYITYKQLNQTQNNLRIWQNKLRYIEKLNVIDTDYVNIVDVESKRFDDAEDIWVPVNRYKGNIAIGFIKSSYNKRREGILHCEWGPAYFGARNKLQDKTDFFIWYIKGKIFATIN